MIAATFTQGMGLDVKETSAPIIGTDEMLIRVDATSICGTDVKIVRHGHRKLRVGQTIVLGHEFVGTIEKIGSQTNGYHEGMRVGVAPNIGCSQCEMCARGQNNMCPNYSAFGIDRDGSHTELVRVPAAAIAQGNVIPLSEDLAPLDATVAEPLSCAVNGIRTSKVRPGDVVLIYGAGPMGLLNLMVALISGAPEIFVADPDETRLEKARDLGATKTFNPVRADAKQWVESQTQGRGVDVVIVATPVAEVQRDAIHLLAPFGRLCLFAGLPTGASHVGFDTNLIHYKNLTVTGMTGGTTQDYRTALKLIGTHRVDATRIISHVFPISQVRNAYDRALGGKGMKIAMVAEKWLPLSPRQYSAVGAEK